MQEKRHSTRKVADQILDICDQITGNQIGRVVNISAEGFMLLSEEPVITGSVYQLKMMIAKAGGDKESIEFGAEAVWCSEASQPDSYWSGFHIIDIDNEDILNIDQMVLDWYSGKD
ncbi:MAG: PilZ domain-containing protein [Candidatus Thiodiazotropha sp.]